MYTGVNVVDRHRSALGECVASFASTFPVAFLEPQFNKFNRNSILYGIAEEDIATHSLEAKGEYSVFIVGMPLYNDTAKKHSL